MLLFCTFGGPLTNLPQHWDVCGGLIYVNAITSPFFLKYSPLLLVSLTSRYQQQAQSTHRSSEIKYPKNYSERCRRVSSSISERVEAWLQRDGSHLPFKVRIMKVISKNDVICSLGRCHQWEESRISRLLCWVYRGKLPQDSRKVIRST